MVHEGITWFAWRGNEPLDMKVIVLSSDKADEHHFPETGKTVKGAFLDMLLTLGLDATGYPTSDEAIEDDIPVQHFQWLTLEEYEPGQVRERSTSEFVYAQDGVATGPAISEQDTGLPAPAITLIAQRLPRHESGMYVRSAEDIQHIVLSHTGVRPGVAVDRLAQAHLRSWPGIACHYLVEADGAIYQTCAITEVVDTQRQWIHHGVIVYVAGNFNDAVPAESQMQALAELIAWLLDAHSLEIESVLGASELIHTQSPGKQWLSGRRWKTALLERVQALLDDYPMRNSGGGDSEGREPEKTVETAPMIGLASDASVREMQSQRSTGRKPSQPLAISKPDIVNLVSELPKHPINRYESRTLEQITHIAVHHSATPANVTPQRIAHYHVSSETHQWPGMGYHFYVDSDGIVNQTQALELISNHVFGHNDYTVGVCLAGDFDAVVPTPLQLAATGRLLAWLMQEQDIPLQNIWGHQDFPETSTSCPGKQWASEGCWKDLLLQQIRIVQGGEPELQDKVLDHYLLLPQSAGSWNQDNLEQATGNYIARFRPTFGYSLTIAMMARRVTLVASSSEMGLEEEKKLRKAGCQVERIAGQDVEQTKQILDRLAESGQRYLEP